MDKRFDRDKFLMTEKHFTIGDKYHIYDEMGEPLFYVEREKFKLYADIHIYDNEQKTSELIRIEDKSVLDFNATMEVREPDSGALLGSFKRDALASMLRRTWNIRDSQEKVIGRAIEDSLFKALLRRFLGRGLLRKLIKTDFNIEINGRQIGEFTRRFTIRDKYVLDLSKDTSRSFDRRLAVALGILLDSAERR